MPALAGLNDIQSNTWSLSIVGPGAIAEGLASLRQCIDLILRTSLGSDPLRPFFGSDIYTYQDKPQNIAIPNIKQSIVTALAAWEPRILVSKVNHKLKEFGHTEFEIVYGIVDSDLLDSIIFDLYNGQLSQANTVTLTLQALFPPNIATRRNQISLVLNNNPATPLPPFNGFSNINETYAWVQANWGSYGRWFLLNDRIQVRLFSGNYQQASLTLVTSNTYRYAASIPDNSGNGYDVIFTPLGGSTYENAQNANLFTKADLLVWIRANLGGFGSWQIENAGTTPGDFNLDFNNDFPIGEEGYNLVLYSDTVTGAALGVGIY